MNNPDQVGMAELQSEIARLRADHAVQLTMARTLAEKAVAQKDDEIASLTRERNEAVEKYQQLVDAICSPSWLPRNKHDSVVKLAWRLRNSQERILPMRAQPCSRTDGHDGPCNGYPRFACPQYEVAK